MQSTSGKPVYNQRYDLSSKPLPQADRRVMVTTDHFRCLGYVDKEGVWRQSFNHQPLQRVLDWESIENVSGN
jgi:hypothetical protein